MPKKKYVSKTVEVEVDVDIDVELNDFDDTDLIEYLEGRGFKVLEDGNLPYISLPEKSMNAEILANKLTDVIKRVGVVKILSIIENLET